ncbi:metallophosphoesterase family protein [Metabacillus litoralis]|uniref:metallophosphoesterase family protein n=1 Tax=Metabacillus litoralis TaxID=152268 RepID=UPI001CFD5D43|nr:DNA repair exonuclease [Metabacillus litoralis]
MKHIKFIHAADLHLDSPFVGLKHMPTDLFEVIRESTFLAFFRIVSYAIKEKVDFILLSGDLYDEEDRSLKAQLKLKSEFEKLDKAGIDVYVIHGNHDHMSGKWLEVEWPQNVHVFSSKMVEMKKFTKKGLPLAYIYGYSYPTRSVVENISNQYIKNDNSSVYHIGMLHGSIEGNKEHDVYCPFKISELVSKGFDYWALGHIHKRQILHHSNPLIAYPGNIQGRHRKEAGEKGFYIVEMNGLDIRTEFVSTEEVIWEEVEVSIEGINNITELLRRCERVMFEIKERNKSTCLTIVLTGMDRFSSTVHAQGMEEDIVDILNEQENTQDHFIWVVKLINKTIQPRENNPKLDAFLTDLHKTVENYTSFDEVIQPLAKHPTFRQYLEKFTLEEQKQLLKEAEQLLHRELLQNSGSK